MNLLVILNRGYNDPDLESGLGTELYLELVEINYNDKFVLNNFSRTILDNYISQEDFEK